MSRRISFVLRGKGNATAALDYRAVRITAAALLTGLLIGAVGAAFRFLLSKADDLRYALVVWAHAWPYLGWLAPVALGTLGAVVSRLMVARFAPEAEGSGIQRVEALYAGEIKPGSSSINLAVKFLGGLLSIGSGLALGREGPTVQMGAALSALASRSSNWGGWGRRWSGRRLQCAHQRLGLRIRRTDLQFHAQAACCHPRRDHFCCVDHAADSR